MDDRIEMTEKDIENARSRAMKLTVFRDLLERGPVLVHVDVAAYGVRVPEDYLNKGPQLILSFSKTYNTQPEIHEEGVEQVLSFQGKSFPVFVSWDSIFHIRDESRTYGHTFPASAPGSLLEKAGIAPEYLN